MRKLVVVTWMVLGLSVLAFAEERAGESVIPGTSTEDEATYIYAGPGLALHAGNLGWAINAGSLSPLGDLQGVYWGADLGLNFWSFADPGLVSASYNSGITGIQLLPSIVYRFEVGAKPAIHPFVGLSVGPHLSLARTTIVTGNQRETSSDVSLLFEALARPGFFAPLGRSASLHVEAKFGVLRSEFIFLPQANVVLAL